MTPSEQESVKRLGGEIGYGNLMYLASQEWGKDLERKWRADGGQFAVGPCVHFTVPCGCELPKDCDWCCGCGWLTKHVKKVKDETMKASNHDR